MGKSIVFAPPEETIDNSLDARKYLHRLSERLPIERRDYEEAEALTVTADLDSVAVLSALSALELQSGYMEVELDTVFGPEELIRRLREAVGERFPVVAVVDDAYSDYITRSYLKAGASAVVGTSGALFGVVTSRMRGWQQIVPYFNAFPSA